MWILSRWEDIRMVESNAELFVNRFGVSLQYAFQDSVVTDDPRLRVALRLPGTTDPPLHTHLRRVVSPSFSPKPILALEPRIRSIASQVLDEIQPDEVVDFVDAVATTVPIRAMCDLLGVSDGRTEELKRWESTDSVSVEPGGKADIGAVTEMLNYLEAEIADRRLNPRDDLISDLISAERNGDRCTDEEVLMWARTVFLAGIGTSSGLLSGGMRALLDHPDQKAVLAADSSLSNRAVEEVLRWVTPVRYMMRTATGSAEIRGVRIAEGDKIYLWYLAGNRDPYVFEDPFRFDIVRKTSIKHLAFGHGPHFCLGAPLAVLVARVLFEELLSRFPNVEWAGEYVGDKRTKLEAAAHMPVRFRR
ncbi:MAG TPA: cytochrome P450 [Candidatus Limnocylindria bacterium]|jgi:cytochrome P450|nr:cytochrome P450 [Candidatus Limnocylindria bacterium]